MPAGKERRDEEVWNDDQEIRRKDRSMADCLCAAAWRHSGAGVIVRVCETGLRERDGSIRCPGGLRKFVGGAGGRGKRRSDAEDWSFDLADYGYDKGYVLNPGDKVVGTIELKNPKYDKIRCMAGFMNTGEGIRQIKETDIWSLTIDASSTDVRPDLMLPGGITWGSTADEVLSVCGQPEEEPYVAEDLGYTVYNWFPDFQYKMKLTVYDDGGLKALTLENYAGK